MFYSQAMGSSSHPRGLAVFFLFFPSSFLSYYGPTCYRWRGQHVGDGWSYAAEGAQPPAGADGHATLPGLGVLSTQEVLERAERYVSVSPAASFGLTVLCEMLLVLHVAIILLDICLVEQMDRLRSLPRGEDPLEEQPGQTEVGATEPLSS
jgi:hypothetical protein